MTNISITCHSPPGDTCVYTGITMMKSAMWLRFKCRTNPGANAEDPQSSWLVYLYILSKRFRSTQGIVLPVQEAHVHLIRATATQKKPLRRQASTHVIASLSSSRFMVTFNVFDTSHAYSVLSLATPNGSLFLSRSAWRKNSISLRAGLWCIRSTSDVEVSPILLLRASSHSGNDTSGTPIFLAIGVINDVHDTGRGWTRWRISYGELHISMRAAAASYDGIQDTDYRTGLLRCY